MHRSSRVLAALTVAAALGAAAEETAYRAHLAESLATVQRTINAGPRRSSWGSLEGCEEPQWFVDGEFGQVIHCGGAEASHALWRVLAPRRALLVFRRRPEVRFGCAGSEIRRPVWPRSSSENP